ncbi:uncharacterized protein METZ01_LOCUS70335 [marine metagenome]|uniref:Uncharacterized protein n=1 Tax=marine metagenome TaxID=408172 RepID=A0A381TPS2_9ZZZZ
MTIQFSVMILQASPSKFVIKKLKWTAVRG